MAASTLLTEVLIASENLGTNIPWLVAGDFNETPGRQPTFVTLQEDLEGRCVGYMQPPVGRAIGKLISLFLPKPHHVARFRPLPSTLVITASFPWILVLPFLPLFVVNSLRVPNCFVQLTSDLKNGEKRCRWLGTSALSITPICWFSAMLMLTFQTKMGSPPSFDSGYFQARF